MTTIITYDQMKEFYNEFKQDPPEDEFRRYTQEYKYLKNLVKLATENNFTQEAEEHQKSLDELVEKLKSLGYKIVD